MESVHSLPSLLPRHWVQSATMDRQTHGALKTLNCKGEPVNWGQRLAFRVPSQPELTLFFYYITWCVLRGTPKPKSTYQVWTKRALRESLSFFLDWRAANEVPKSLRLENCAVFSYLLPSSLPQSLSYIVTKAQWWQQCSGRWPKLWGKGPFLWPGELWLQEH